MISGFNQQIWFSFCQARCSSPLATFCIVGNVALWHVRVPCFLLAYLATKIVKPCKKLCMSVEGSGFHLKLFSTNQSSYEGQCFCECLY